jgi:lysozyme
MNIKQLREEIAVDEGIKLEVYNDHLGLKTCGIGHLVLDQDEEFDLPIGTPISEERCNELFDKDIQTTINDCKKVYDDWYNLPEEIQKIIANMMFNLGYPRYCKFKKKIQAIKDGDWFEASIQMTDSRWYSQVPNRAKRLVERMRSFE